MKRNSEDKPEFQDVYTAFNEKVRRYLARLVCETEAEDLTHEVFIKSAKAFENFRGYSRLPTCIYRADILVIGNTDRVRNTAEDRSVLGGCHIRHENND